MKLKPETIQQHRARQALYLRSVHKLCASEPDGTSDGVCDPKHRFSAYALAWCIGLAAVLLCFRGCEVAHADILVIKPQYCPKYVGLRANCMPVSGYTCTDIVEAIGKIENSHAHPYGIMVKYKHTSPWQACMNTVRHNVRNYIKEGCKGPFLAYLARHYAPIGAGNDPQGLNKNWLPNLKAILNNITKGQ